MKRWGSSRRAGQPRRRSPCRPHRHPSQESTSSTSEFVPAFPDYTLTQLAEDGPGQGTGGAGGRDPTRPDCGFGAPQVISSETEIKTPLLTVITRGGRPSLAHILTDQQWESTSAYTARCQSVGIGRCNWLSRSSSAIKCCLQPEGDGVAE